RIVVRVNDDETNDVEPGVDIYNLTKYWARNLLANRSYTCPVIFFEPYVMNNADVYARIQEGDYEGERVVNGISRPSIMREYAEAVAAGMKAYFTDLGESSKIRDLLGR
ncbi:MAG: hypothetical protein AAF357_11315, partial [Verrucomicrobiota bacterium]